MSESATFQEFRRKYAQAVDAGLVASGYQYYNELKRRLAGGYTTGDYVTGNVLNSITVSPPFDRNGVRTVLIGTSQTDPPYPAYWEFGHFNIFTGRFERVEHWRESMLAAEGAMFDAFGRAFGRVLRS